MTLKSHLLTTVLTAAIPLISLARNLEDYCWFYAGFDTPVRIAGGEFPQSLSPAGFYPGKYGQGYYFHSDTENKLPPMAEFLADASNFSASSGTLVTGETLSFSGGTFTVLPRRMSLRYDRAWTTRTSGYTCSFFVRGAADTTLSMQVLLTPLTDAEYTTITNKAATTQNWTPVTTAALGEDSSTSTEYTLSGDWQRVFAYATFDSRAQAVGREVTLSVSSSGPIEMKNFQYRQTGEYPALGNYSPTVYVDGGQTLSVPALATSDKVFTRSFPSSEGSSTAWVKCIREDAAISHYFPIWGLARSWQTNWELSGRNFICGAPSSSNSTLCYDTFSMPWEWRHYAVTWKDGTVSTYVDGVLLSKRVKTGLTFEDMSVGASTFRLGMTHDGSVAANCIMDDVAIFSTALTPEEISAIASSPTPLFDGSRRILAAPVSFTTFYRNDTNAALRAFINAPVAGTYNVSATIGGEDLDPFELTLPAGKSRLEIRFAPSRYECGEYPWAFSLSPVEGGLPVLERSGTLKIMPRLERAAFKVLSWGGSKTISHAFLHEIGVNTISCTSESTARSATDDGFFANLRMENSSKIKAYDFDYASLAADTVPSLEYARGLHTWATTLVNTEVYSAGTAASFTNCPTFIAMARAELGHDPDWHFGNGMTANAEVQYSPLGQTAPSGIVDGSHPTFRTLRWYLDDGMPAYRLGSATVDEIHKIDPSNIAWSEPSMTPGGMSAHFDMLASWFYDHNINTTLTEIRSAYACNRPFGHPFMPTLGGGYTEGNSGYNPDGEEGQKSTTVTESADEMQIRSWLALGAARCDSLSLFGADYWEYGVSNALIHAETPSEYVSPIADPADPARYGNFINQRFLPVAELLKGLENVRAPIAVVLTAEATMAGGNGWGGVHFPNWAMKALADAGVPFDVIREHEVTADVLKQYKYALCMLSKLVTAEHDAAFRAAANAGTIIVMDNYATAAGLSYPNGIILTNFKYNYYNQEGNIRKPPLDFFTNRLDEIKAILPAYSESDFGMDNTSFTFTKEYDGVSYVTVINNARGTGSSILTDFKPDAAYRPYGASQRIATHLKVPNGGVVYEIDPVAGGRLVATGNTAPVVELDYQAAEGKVLAVYPKPLSEVRVAFGGDFEQGGVAYADVTVLDSDGDPAPGRQVVSVSVTDPCGTRTDETGIYTVEGTKRIPIRFTRNAACGTLDGAPWTMVTTDITSGLCVTNYFALPPPKVTVNAYVQTGLWAQWDAIDNAGVGIHDPNATTWVDLKGGPVAFPMTGCTITETNISVASGYTPTVNSTVFKNQFYDQSYTYELRLSTPGLPEANSYTDYYYLTLDENYFYRQNNTQCIWTFLCAGSPNKHWARFPYSTAEQRVPATAAFVTGATSVSDCGMYLNGEYRAKVSDAQTSTISSIRSRAALVLTATKRAYPVVYNTIRIYPRVLPAEDVAWNAMIDHHRFDGAPLTEGMACSEKKVECGRILFKVLAYLGQQDAGTLSVNGGTSEAWLDPGVPVTVTFTPAQDAIFSGWKGLPEDAVINGTTVSFVMPEGYVCISPVASLPVITDVAASAYIQRGLVAHFDGIENAGVRHHSETLANWKNLKSGTSDAVLPEGLFTIADDHMSFDRAVATATGLACASSTAPITLDACVKATSAPGVNALPFLTVVNRGMIGYDSRNNYGYILYAPNSSSWGSTKNFYEWFGTFSYAAKAYDRQSVAGICKIGASANASALYNNGAKVDYRANWTSAVMDAPDGKVIIGHTTVSYDVYSARIYDRELSADEIAVNANIDEIRFGHVDPDTLTWPTGFIFTNGEVSVNVVFEASAHGHMQTNGTTLAAGTCLMPVNGFELLAVPDEGYVFSHWQGTLTGDPDEENPSLYHAAPSASGLTVKPVFRKASGNAFALHAADYVRDGLIFLYDSYENAGPMRHESGGRVWRERFSGLTFTGHVNTHFNDDFFATIQATTNMSVNTVNSTRWGTIVHSGEYTMECCFAITNACVKGPNGSVNNSVFEWSQDRGRIGVPNNNNLSTMFSYSKKASAYEIKSAVTLPFTNTLSAVAFGTGGVMWTNGIWRARVDGLTQAASGQTTCARLNQNWWNNCGINGGYFNLRAYDHPLSHAQMLHNATVDAVRFKNDEHVRYMVLSSPRPEELGCNYGAPVPAYGANVAAYGEEKTFALNGLASYDDGAFAAPLADGVRAVCGGYIVSNAFGIIDENASQSATSVTLSLTNLGTSVCWRFRDQNRIVLQAPPVGGTVQFYDLATGDPITVAGTSVTNWVDAGSSIGIRAIPADGFAFAGWTGASYIGDSSSAETSVLADEAKIANPVFTETHHVPCAAVLKSGVTDGNWFDGACWERGMPPGEGDWVTIPANRSTVRLVIDVSTPHLQSITVADSAQSCTIEMRNWETCLVANDIYLGNGAVMTCPGGFGMDEMSNRVWIAANRLEIASGAKIDVSGCGYGKWQGPGFVPGDTDDANNRRGGTHGGRQGYPRPSLQDLAPGTNYDVPEAPLYPGTGGGTLPGGGAVKLDITSGNGYDGQMIINGQIIADSASAKAPGSGGSVWITCETIEGDAYISASAFRNMNNAQNTTDYGGGGGGRIAVCYNTSKQNAKTCALVCEACGSVKAKNDTSRSWASGEPGTIWFSDTRFIKQSNAVNHSGILLADNFDSWNVNGTLTVLKKIGFADGFSLSVNGDLMLVNSNKYGAGLDITAGTLNVRGNTLVKGALLKLMNGSNARLGGDLTLESASADNKFYNCRAGEVWLQAAATNGLAAAVTDKIGAYTNGVSATLTVDGTWTLKNNTFFLPMCENRNGAVTRVKCGKFILETGATVFADQLGWRMGSGIATAKAHQGGASHYSRGSATSASYLTKTYDDYMHPVYPGSGGVSREGGGAVWIEADKRITVDGTITAQMTRDAQTWSSAASGGSIYLVAGKVNGTGTMRACGQNGNGYAFASAGGSIAIWSHQCTTNGFTFAVDAGENTQTTSYPPEDGTVYWGALRSPGTMLILH